MSRALYMNELVLFFTHMVLLEVKHRFYKNISDFFDTTYVLLLAFKTSSMLWSTRLQIGQNFEPESCLNIPLPWF